ncbi:MAG: DUF1854 domain-containing protein [Oscillospiraceae bacterium]|nr:DUF1854 domain-containing protein [Oscillospiraceae bacterium]
MERIYIDGHMAKFTRKDITTVDVQLQDGTIFQNVEPRCLFPSSDGRNFITLLDENGIEQAVIRSLDTLPAEQREIIEGCLAEYYLIPRITKILNTTEKFGLITLDTETDRGPARIEIRNLLYGFKQVGNRLLLRDGNDNRYEVPDLTKLDAKSRHLLDNFI